MIPNPSDPPLPEPKRIALPPAFEEQPGRRKNGPENPFRYGRLLTRVVGSVGLMGGLLWAGWQLGRSAADRDPGPVDAPAVENAIGVSGEKASEPVDSPKSLFAAGSAAYLAKHYPEAFAKLSKAAERGHSEAEYIISEMFFYGHAVEKDFAEGLRWCRKAADHGFVMAQHTIGNMYAQGMELPLIQIERQWWATPKGNRVVRNAAQSDQWWWLRRSSHIVEADPVEAAQWYRKAAEKGDKEAQYKLSGIYSEGTGTAKDEAEGLRWHLKAAEQGHFLAQLNLAEKYSRGTGVPKDQAEAAKWFRKVADQGMDYAQGMLGWMYLNGEGVAKDQAEAAKWYRKAADQGMAEAQNSLAWLYFQGAGVAKDTWQAAYWFRKSAEQGNASAANSLGWMYETGEGVLKDPPEAVRWYRQAADQGNCMAQCNLANMYGKGTGIAKDPVKATQWYRKSAIQGYAEAQNFLGAAYAVGSGVAKDYKEANRWFQKAAKEGHALSQFNLGLSYYKGEGIPKDFMEAVRWFRKASDQGFATAQNYLGGMYYNGEGVPKNLVFAYKWFLLAKAGGEEGKGSDMAEKLLSPAQREEGQRLAAAFSPKVEHAEETIGPRPSVLESEGLVTMKPEGGKESSMPRPFKPAMDGPDYLSGTGFFIGESGYLITAAHVVTKAATVFACLPDGRKLPLRLIRMDTKLDLALFQIPSAEPLPRGLPIVSSKSLALGQPVMTIGFPNPDVQGNAPKFTDGKVSALTGAGDSPNTIQVSVPVQPGNSGGALVDMAGRVVGVISHRLDAIVMARQTGALSENVNYAVKSSHLLAFLEGTPAASTGAGAADVTPAANATPEAIQTVKDATVQIVAEKQR